MPRSLDYLRRCRREGVPVIGASSLGYDVASGQYPSWLRLPYIHEADFNAALGQAIHDCDIGGIYTPNPVIWNHLQGVLGDLAPGVTLVNASPVDELMAGYLSARADARELLAHPLALASSRTPKKAIAEIAAAAMLRHADTVPGMCGHEKIRALHEIARRAVAGDIVEIGSWWGKSACVLASLARLYDIGRLLCVDPWSNQHLVQHDEHGLVDKGSALMDAEEALAVFEMNLLPYDANRVNYLRMPSTDGARHYRSRRSVTSASFGTMSYEGRIALLHIDGNHAYAAVKADIAAWTDLVADGGWIVLDDYTWPFGDGPRRAGDELLAEHRRRIECAFVMGGALFLQLS
jgi:cephalosporin hydroxylase